MTNFSSDGWRVEELTTSGWAVQDPKRDLMLTKEHASSRLNWYLSEGVSPDRIRAVPDK